MKKAVCLAVCFLLSGMLAAASLLHATGNDPLTILRYGPRGSARGQVQIRIDFDRPIVPLAALGEAERSEILSFFRLDPPAEGGFRILGTSTVVFEPAASLPLASRYTVSVKEGLKAIDGGRLQEPLSWSFTTSRINIWIDPPDKTDHVVLSPEPRIRSSIALETASLEKNLAMVRTRDGANLPFTLAEDEQNAPAGEDLGVHRRVYIYHMRLASDLERDTTYEIAVAPGVAPRRGNLPTERRYVSRIRTYPPFRFSWNGFCDGCGPHLRTRPFLNFTNKPDWEDFGRKVTISPPAGKWPFRKWGCDHRRYAVTLDDRLLEPGTVYTVTLPPELTDIYGQRIENPKEVSFETGPLTPRFWGPAGYQVMSPNLPPEFALETAGISTVYHRLVPLEPGDILVRELLNERGSIRNLLKTMPGERLERGITLGENGRGRTVFDLRELYRAGEFGAVLYSLRSPKPPCYKEPLRQEGILLRSNLGLYSQFLPTGGRIAVNRLTDGAPVGGAKITIYRSDDLPRLEKVWDKITGERLLAPADPCAEGTTADDGLLRLDAAAMAACSKRRISNKVLNELYPPEADPDDILYDQRRYGMAEPPLLNIIAEKENDWTFLQTREYGVPSIWRFGVRTAWEAERPVPRGTIFSDRNIYRPGELVRMKGLSRYLLYGKMHTGAGSTYTVSVTDPRGRRQEITEVTVSDFGTFTLDVPTKPGQPLGRYQVIAQGAHTSLRFSGAFRLAEFRAPEFLVSLETGRPVALAGEAVRIAWDGRYYFGAPMAEAPSTLNIVRSETVFVPEGRRDFRFGIPTWLEDRRASLGGQVSSEKIPLDSEGKATRILTVKRGELPRPMLYQAFAEVEDVSRQTAGAEGAVTLLPDDRLVGVRLDRWIVQKKEAVTAEVIVTDPDGRALAGIPLKVKLLRREWHAIQREVHGGRLATERQQVLTEVQSTRVTSGEDAAGVHLTPPAAGSYMVRAELAEAPESGTAAATALWAAGDDYVPWRGSGEDRLEIIFDKEKYSPGEEAVALIRSPFRKADLYITLCRDRIFSEEIIPIEGSAFTYRFTVTEEMLPNAFLGAFLVNRGGPLVPVNEETGRHMEKIGFAPFRVDRSSRYLSVAVETDKEKYRPSNELQVKVKVNNKGGEGHRSELTVMVVDESILALTGYRPPDLVETVYADRGLSVRVNDNRPFLISKDELLQKGHGHGGGMEEGGRLRRRFLRLAYYEPSLVTDESGETSFRFTLPDNLTTFRIMVVAVGEDDLFGYGDRTITVTQPFVMRPAFPRYTRVGDSFLAGVGVTNLSGADGRFSLRAEIVSGGDALRFSGEDPSRAAVEDFAIREGESTSILFGLESLAAGRGLVRFTASFDGSHEGRPVEERDAFETAHRVRELSATETVVAVGETLEEALQEIRVGADVRSDAGGLQVRLSSSALAGLGESAGYLVAYPYGCLEQTVSRLLALIELKHLAEKYGFVLEAGKPLDKVIAANLRKLYAMQNWDGGFKFWPTGERSTCWISPYVAQLFARMLQLGYEVPEDTRDGLKRYLQKVLRNPCTVLGSWRTRAEYRIRILTALAALGAQNQTWFEEYFSRRNDLSYGAQIALASLLLGNPEWREKALLLAGEIMNGLFVTAQTAHFEEPRDLPPSWSFLSSPVITTAEGLRLLLEVDPGSDLAAKMSRYLLNARVNGRWRNTFENGRALDALIETSLVRESEEPDFHASVRLAGKAVMEELFSGHSTEMRRLRLPIDGLPRGLSPIAVSKRGTGRLYYTLAYSYRLRGPQPARSEGFAVKRTVRDWGTKRRIALYGEEAPPPAVLKSGGIYEIELEFRVPQSGHHFVLSDSLPAGMEPIDTSLKTTSGRYRGSIGTEDTRRGDHAFGYRRNPFNHKELRDDGASLFADAVRPGLYRFRYLARATAAGTYLWPGARASLMYEPEQFGTSAEGEVRIEK